MKKIALYLTALCLPFAASAYFENKDDFALEQERMLLASDGIYIISTFEDSDHASAYTYYGDLIWDTPFHAKIISWQVSGNNIIVFSKHRSGTKTYLTCLDRYSGRTIWQRP